MPGKITDEIIEYVGILAKLELSGDEKKAAKSDMERPVKGASHRGSGAGGAYI